MSANPRQLGKYELQEQRGSGAMAQVWKALDTRLQRLVAIKVLHANLQEDPHFIVRFEREAQLIASLDHLNIVRVHDFQVTSSQEQGTIAYLIMDYVEGQSLADYLDATAHQGKFPSSTEIVSLLTPIAAALDYAHQHNVIHGALKPTAILFKKASATATSPGDPKLIDFGMNQMRNLLTLPPSDVHYLSPESAQGYAATSRSDIYSLGVMLYELCTGAPPFQGETPGDILMQHIHGTPTPPALINPHISPLLAATIMRSLARDPAARFSTATALVAAAARALNVSMPQDSKGLSNPSLRAVNPPVLSGISDPLNTMNSPTYLSPLPQPSQQTLAASDEEILPTIFANLGDALAKLFSRRGSKKQQETQLSLFAIARTSLEADDRALVGKVYTVLAGVSQNRPADFRGEPFTVSVQNPTEPLLFGILLHPSENIELMGARYQLLRYDPRDVGPQYISCPFRLKEPGQSYLVINFYRERQWLQTIRFEFEGVVQPTLSTTTRGR